MAFDATRGDATDSEITEARLLLTIATPLRILLL